MDDMKKLRAEFEVWLCEGHSLDITWRGHYVHFPVHIAFKAWCAARRQPDAGVVEHQCRKWTMEEIYHAFNECYPEPSPELSSDEYEEQSDHRDYKHAGFLSAFEYLELTK